MSDNKLLTENTIRRFMKLANTDAFSDNFISENQVEELEEEVEETNEEINEEEEVELEENLEDLEEKEEPEEGQAGMTDPDAPMSVPADDAPAEMGAADMSLTEEEAKLLISLGERLSNAMAGDADKPEPEAEEPGADMEVAMGEEDPAGEEEPAAGAYGRPVMEADQDELVNEVLKRVTKRLVAEKLNRK